jgi:lysophospholipase L1-like esterase
VAAEGVVRLYAAIGGEAARSLARSDPAKMLFVPMGDYGYRQKPGGSQTYQTGAVANWNTMGYRGPEVSVPKPPGTFRIILLGGSTTHGFGVDDQETIDSHMRAMFERTYPDQRIEVVNLALGGYDSYQVSERMRIDGIEMQPDVVIVNSGINDVRNAPYSDLETVIDLPDRRTLLWQGNMNRLREQARRGRPDLWSEMGHYFYLPRLPSFVYNRLSIRPRVEQALKANPKPDAIDYFAKNILRTAAFVRAANAMFISSTPPSSLATLYKPTDTSGRGYWIVDAGTTETYRKALATELERLTKQLAAKGHAATYLAPDVETDRFLDDCHLTSEGNRDVAADFVDVLQPFVHIPKG